MDIKFIAMDLDGTLMRSDKSISEYSVSVLKQCRERGIYLAFATARSEKASERAHALIQPDIMITCGGALVKHNGKILSETPLRCETANSVIKYCRSLASVGRVLAEMENMEYYVSNPVMSNPVGDYAHARQYDFSKPLDSGVYKLVIQIADKREKRSVAEKFPDVNTYGYIGSDWCFIADKYATKWNGVKMAASVLGIGAENIAAFGDDVGDAEMLANCGVGVAMANAAAEAKPSADFICESCDEDGMARWIEENVLEESENTLS